MDRTELAFALAGLAAGALAAVTGFTEAFEKVLIAGVLLIMVLGFASFHFVLYRLRTDHPAMYNEIGATNEDLSWGMGDAFRRFRKLIRGTRHRELGDDFLSTAVLVGRITWRLSFGMAGFVLVFAARSFAG